ncbi:hypothetical protein [Thiothrix winogradskyi]|uniref:Uncharacterized protein n=1 Tax=Thiothrix winogradskyi TaxID=96472 RepID=A0ABY3T253_9GAMM|nr:hypothetical protein [Thiothrix winogradskyi]UJS25624.1 hypothetical protein L2Y54_06170 [Thiothrix winogradskyi]
MKTFGILVFCLATLCACTPPTGSEQATTRATVTGTTTQPDPVETQIRALEKAGKLKVLAVRESFPLQFELEGSAQAIAEVQALAQPR